MAAPSSGAALESLAMKRLRSFALFAAKKRVKYAAACELFGQAARAYLSEDNLDKAAECCKQQARLCINKLQQPVESAMHYMESTRAYMLSEEYTLAFQCLQLAVQARTHPNQKHKFDDPHAAPFSVTGITVTETPSVSAEPPAPLSQPVLTQQLSDPTHYGGTGSENNNHHASTQQQQQQRVSPDLAPLVLSSSASSSHSSPVTPARKSAASFSGSGGLLPSSVLTRSPALTSQAGTISAEGKSLFLSPETMHPPISSREGRSGSMHGQSGVSTAPTTYRSISIQPHPHSSSSTSSSSSASAASAGAAATAASSNGAAAAAASPSPAHQSSSSSSLLSSASGGTGGLSSPSSSLSSSKPSSSSSSSSVPCDLLSVPPGVGGVGGDLRPRQRRHSLSGSANSSNVTMEGAVVQAVLHLDLLLARLAVQLAADLWVHLDFRDAILSLEIASSLFATLLIAERQVGTFRRRRTNNGSMMQKLNAAAAAAAAGSGASGTPAATPSASISSHAPASSLSNSSFSSAGGGGGGVGGGMMSSFHLAPDPPLLRSESATSPNTPTHGSSRSPVATSTSSAVAASTRGGYVKGSAASTLAIQERLAGLLGPSAYSTRASSQTLGAMTLSSRPIINKPVASLLASRDDLDLALLDDRHTMVLHQSDPHLSVGEGEGYFEADEHHALFFGSGAATSPYHHGEQPPLPSADTGTTLLEESLVCRMQLAVYYVTFDEELDSERSVENQELRRSKALFEQVASQKPDQCLLHANLVPVFAAALAHHSDGSNCSGGEALVPPGSSLARCVGDAATLVSQYAADDSKLHTCLFMAGLCDALIGIRVYIASQAKPAAAVVAGANGKSGKKGSAAPPPPPPPPIPELYRQTRTVFCPPILLRYRDMCASFGETAEIRLLRSCSGLLQMAASLSQRLNDAFGGSAPRVAKQLFQAAWGAEIIREFTAVVEVFTRQRPLTNVAAKLLLQLKKQMKIAITL